MELDNKMKITKRQLKRIIKEEKARLLSEIRPPFRGGYQHEEPDNTEVKPTPGGYDRNRKPDLTGMEIEPSVDAIEDILNGLSGDGLDNADLIKLLEDIIGNIKAGFVGEPS
jgi:hypothetical protein